jgi:hypothetical protein
MLVEGEFRNTHSSEDANDLGSHAAVLVVYHHYMEILQ